MTMKVCQNLVDLDPAGIKTFFDSFDTVLCDCDGVLWLSQEAIPGSPEAIRLLKSLGKRVIFVTNNSNRTRNEYAIKFKNLGYEDITKADIIQAGFLTAAYLHEKHFSKKVYVIGEDGLESELQELGISYINQRDDPLPDGWNEDKIRETLDNLDPDVNCVMVGFDPNFSYMKMLKACNYIQRSPDCHFVVSDVDGTFPAKKNLLLPGTGPMVSAIKTITGREPTVCGKPNPFVFETIQRIFPEVVGERTIMIGDRANSDILLGNRCGLKTLMVGTGCHNMEHIQQWQTSGQDDLVANFYVESLGKIVDFMSQRNKLACDAKKETVFRFLLEDFNKTLVVFMSFKALGRVLSSCSWALKGSQHLTTRRFSISSHIMSGYPQTCQELAKLSPAEVQKFMDSFDTVMTDCDGVLWMGDRAFDGAAKMICKFRELGKKVFFCTNNSTKSRADYVEKCKKLGFGGNKDEIIGTSYLAATYLKDMNYKGTVYVVGTNGVKDELDEVGIPCIGIGPDPMPDQWSLDKMAEIASKVGPEVQCVIAAFDNLISYVKLMKAVSVLSRPNSVFVATNTDEQFPFSSSCILPGTGSMVAAIAASAEREPVVMGKPSPMMFEVVQKHHPEVNPKRTLMIGDRANTDILLGKNCNLYTLMVGTGCHSLANIREWEKSDDLKTKRLVADFYLDKLADLYGLLQ
ncbi:uncharacterized protein LOC131889474 [Tigriopus californicus]|uniref:uncharacterized protein LOC131889474 n=1 Tax=Tigriopus californicus TaxID=6832 RepID=UPI0027DA97AB|nr:uncharacterized protein LOC131889474 [Tigriopus californicus]